MAVPQYSEALNGLFSQLTKTKDETKLAQVASELSSFAANAPASMPSEMVKDFDQAINKRLFDLTHSTQSEELYAGLAVINAFLDSSPGDTNDSRLFRYFNYAKAPLPSAETNDVLAASTVLGKIAKRGGAFFGDAFVETQVRDAIQALQRSEQGRYGAILLLKELARNLPTYFGVHIGLIFDKLLIGFRDAHANVREATGDLLAACLDILRSRGRGRDQDAAATTAMVIKVLEDVKLTAPQPPPGNIHGTLVAYRNLLLHGQPFVYDHYERIGEEIYKYRSNRDILVRQTVVSLIPTLAAADAQLFKKEFMHKCMNLLQTMLDKPAERSRAFIAIGHVARSINGDIKQFVEPCMKSVHAGLEQHGRRGAPMEEPIFQCIGMLAEAVGPNLTRQLHENLDLMFNCGLSEALRQALTAIAEHIAPLLKTIQEKLLNMLSTTLSGQPYRPIGAPAPVGRSDLATLTRDFRTSSAASSREQVILALETLGSFDFSGHVLNEFIRNVALPYLEDDNPDVRQAAALTCCKLFVKDPIVHQASSHSLEIINDVVDKLLTAGIADPEPSIRQTVLSNLDERFDKHLAQAENVRSLFIALNDEAFENREIATRLIGRLAMHNPAYAMPSLRKAILQLLTELEYSTVSRSREECVRLLTLLIGATQRLIKPYALTILDTLLPKASDPNPAVASNIILAIGELSAVAGEDAIPRVPRLMEIILAVLEDPSVPSKRDAALSALGQICSSTGYVIQPLVDYPQLLTLLSRILATVQNVPGARREVMKVLGLLGALDPYKRLTSPEEDSRDNAAINQVALAKPQHLVGEDYFQNVVVNCLLGILRDHSLISHHANVIDAIMSIFKTQGLRSVAHLPQIFPAFTLVARTAPKQQDHYIQQIAILIEIVKEHVRNYVPELLKMIVELWEHVPLQLPIVSVIEALGKALDAEFKPFLPAILPSILHIFELDLTEKLQQTQIKVFSALLTLSSNVEEYMHLIIPVIVKTFESEQASLTLRKSAVVCIEGLSRRVNFSDHASRLIHPLVRTLEAANNELRLSIMDSLCAMVTQLGCDFAIFVPMINKVLAKQRISHPKYENLIKQLLKGERVTHDSNPLDLIWNDVNRPSDFALPVVTKLQVNQHHLKQAWDISAVSNQDDWNDWMNKLSVEFLKESPSHALRACMTLVESYKVLARELFNAAFLSCWSELYESYQEGLVRSIEQVIISQTAPYDVVVRMLNLAEFMEQKNLALPISHRTLGETAFLRQVYAKALHHKEIDIFQDTIVSEIEALISINTKLQQHDAAWGTLLMAKEQLDQTEHEVWYERLGRWQEALDAYNRKREITPDSMEVFSGRMRCLHALGEWQQLAVEIDEHWVGSSSDQEFRRELAPKAAAAAWSLNEWDAMDDYIGVMKKDSPDKGFYKAILAIHKVQYPKAMGYITAARDLLYPDMVTLLNENYGRAYTMMTKLQALSELEEIITYKQHAEEPERQLAMRRTWMKRLQGCQPDVEVWQKILQVRSLVLRPEEDAKMWIKFGNLCRKAKRFALAEKTFNSLIPANGVNASPDVVYAQVKLEWAEAPSESCLDYLRNFSSTLKKSIDGMGQGRHHQRQQEELRKLLARCYFKLGDWEVALKENWYSSNEKKEVLNSYHRATQLDAGWYKAWHNWALANFEVVNHLDSRGDNITEMESEELSAHIIAAIRGFFHSISLRRKKVLQDTLRLLTLWFKYGDHDEISLAISQGFATVDIVTWLDVIPQIIARIQTPSTNIFRNINFLLSDIARQHPQALIYPLTVATQSQSATRRLAAMDIMNGMRQHSPEIVLQAQIVSKELLRVAILWHEMWHEGLEEASRFYYTEHNVDAMLATLEPLHEKIEAGPQTQREAGFITTFGRDLAQAKEACQRFRRYGQQRDIDEAWQIYYAVFKKLDKQIQTLVTIDLHYVSPALLKLVKLKHLSLAVPGTYIPGQANGINIASFVTKLSVMATKQHPRRLLIRGEDGRDYEFLLKGHEDLRQDERLMQFFSLVNDLLAVDPESYKRRLHIQRFPAIPLAPNAGLIGFMQGSETLHALIRDYRDTHKILADIERRLMMQMSPDHDQLTSMQKLEVFEHAILHSTGQDLYRSLWEKSHSSEHWIERRATYTSSLAVNSMVGHVLGLGDRHPSNILLLSETGKVVHVDFGDCFEVAMHREKYPERVPFRLTRMLRKAMDVSGVRGSFRVTCEITMRVLRDNRESLMAVLEALVYDPLISWRLAQPEQPIGAGNTGAPREGNAPGKRAQADEREIFKEAADEHPARAEMRNEKALRVCNRVKDKLTGRDFDPNVVLPVDQQVEKLINQAQDNIALSQHFTGWCAFW